MWSASSIRLWSSSVAALLPPPKPPRLNTGAAGLVTAGVGRLVFIPCAAVVTIQAKMKMPAINARSSPLDESVGFTADFGNQAEPAAGKEKKKNRRIRETRALSFYRSGVLVKSMEVIILPFVRGNAAKRSGRTTEVPLQNPAVPAGSTTGNPR